MKKLLIISPSFPPVNAADMQRVRMSLPFFTNFGYQAEVVTIDPRYNDHNRDELLVESVPHETVIHRVKAFSKSWTSKVGLGSIALRSLIFYKSYVDKLLKTKKFDLIYFSTTQFPVCTLGPYWKKKFGIPYVIDMQDPWHSDYYLSRPKNERPPKYWFSYRLNKFLEPIAMKEVDGLISVSQGYLDTLSARYPHLKDIPQEVITFGAFERDIEIAKTVPNFHNRLNPDFLNLVYIGRGGKDMEPAFQLLLEAFKEGLTEDFNYFSKFKLHFIGTSYAPKGKGSPTTSNLVKDLQIDDFVIEKTDRIPFYDSINCLSKAQLLFIPGSRDPHYTASKIYPYILAEKPILSIFNKESSAHQILNGCDIGLNLTFQEEAEDIKARIKGFFKNYRNINTSYNQRFFEKFTARTMTARQCAFFDLLLSNK